MRVIATAAICSPVVVSRRANYDVDFRVPTLLGAPGHSRITAREMSEMIAGHGRGQVK
jgi:hypothetical protein